MNNCIITDHDECYELSDTSLVRARKAHKCCECDDGIPADFAPCRQSESTDD